MGLSTLCPAILKTIGGFMYNAAHLDDITIVRFVG